MINNPKIIVTVGPATKSLEHLAKMKDLGVDFVRVNMSHSDINQLKYFIKLSKKVGLPFILDTEGSQIRTGKFQRGLINFNSGDNVKIYARPTGINKNCLYLTPGYVIQKLEKNDLIHADFDGLVLKIRSADTLYSKGYVIAASVVGGSVGSNKSVVIESTTKKELNPPPLSDKDYKAIALAMKEGIKYVALSFARKPEDVDLLRKETRGQMKIISKIECVDGLSNLDGITKKSDFLLIDRGDLSKEIPIEKIPLVQKMIIKRAKKFNKGVFVATNLLETMVEKKGPTRAEVNDVFDTVLDGAYGLTLAAETAVGRYPTEAVTMLKKIISQAMHFNKNKENLA